MKDRKQIQAVSGIEEITADAVCPPKRKRGRPKLTEEEKAERLEFKNTVIGRPPKDANAANATISDDIETTAKRLIKNINQDVFAKDSAVSFKEKVDYLGKLLQYAVKHEENKPQDLKRTPNELAAEYMQIYVKAGIKKEPLTEGGSTEEFAETILLSEHLDLSENSGCLSAMDHVTDPS